MGMNSGNNQGPMADINVTPLVDVSLVLLIIFMVTAPLMLNGIKMQLPKTKEVNRVHLTTQQVVLSFTLDEKFYIGKDEVKKSELISLILNKFSSSKTDTLFLRADYKSEYGKVAHLMSFLKDGGIQNIALVTETEKDK